EERGMRNEEVMAAGATSPFLIPRSSFLISADNAALSPPTPLSRGGEGSNASVYRKIFRERCYLAAAVHCGPDDDAELEHQADLARQVGLPLVATNDVHYHGPGRRRLHDVLTAIKHGTTVAELG